MYTVYTRPYGERWCRCIYRLWKFKGLQIQSVETYKMVGDIYTTKRLESVGGYRREFQGGIGMEEGREGGSW